MSVKQKTGEDTLNELERTLRELQQDGYVSPGWKASWSDLDNAFMVTFQLCHAKKPEAMTESEFQMWLHGWGSRRAAVMARRPRREQPRQAS